MFRDRLIGELIFHKSLGWGVISGFKNTGNKKHIIITFPKSEDPQLYDFPSGIVDSELFSENVEFINKLKQEFFLGWDGTYRAKSDYEDKKIQCQRCYMYFPYTAEENIKRLSKGGTKPRYCAKCRKAINNELSKAEIKQLMRHDKPKDSKKKQIHDTDGMSI